MDSWQIEHGLPDNFITAIQQTSDGYLWIATFNGLARFNGVEFVVFDSANTPELPTSRIAQLHADRQGRLWIISEYGHLTCRTEEGFQRFGPEKGAPERNICRLREDIRGKIWITEEHRSRQFYHFGGNAFVKTNSVEAFEVFAGVVSGSDDDVWWLGENMIGRRDRNGETQYILTDFEGVRPTVVASRDGGIWIISRRLQKFLGNELVIDSPLPARTDQLAPAREDRFGNLWVGTGIGELWCFETNRGFRRFRLEKSAATELGRTILEDAEGNLWLGTGGHGLFKVKAPALQSFDSRRGLASDVIRSLAEDREGRMWVVTVNGVNLVSAEGTVSAVSGLSTDLPWCVYPDQQGAVWIGSFGHGLFQWAGGKVVRFAEPGRNEREPGVFGSAINVIFQRQNGELLMGTPDGLHSFSDHAIMKAPTPPGLRAVDIRAIAENKQSHLYLGLNGQGMLRMRGAEWDHFTSTSGLPGNSIWAIHVDEDDVAWIGLHGGGLCRFKDGEFFPFRDSGVGLPRAVGSILEDDRGHLWIGSNQGLFRAERRQLNALAERRTNSVAVTHFDRTDGMGSSQCTGDRQPTAWKAKDGRLWFATMKGVTVVDPYSLPVNARPPPVAIEAVMVDDKHADVRTIRDAGIARRRSEIRVSPGAHRLEFRYTGLSFSAPDKVRFQYRLEGFDSGWVQAGARRAAYYTQVPPGDYQFRVIACNNDNVWNEQGAAMAVVVLPYFWQTGWFKLIVVLCAGGLVFGLYEWRVSRLTRERLVQEAFARRLLDSQESERKRMAAELHDSLGQNLLVVKNYAMMALKEGIPQEKMRSQLRAISESTSASIEEVRSIARALRPYQLDRFGLSKTLEDAADLIARTASLNVSTEIDNVDKVFPPEVEISVLRVVQEWLNNVVKHAEASSASLTVRKNEDGVRIVMEDDGKGFDLAAVASGSFGLANMRERVRLMMGNIEVETAPGKGTRLSVDIPV